MSNAESRTIRSTVLLAFALVGATACVSHAQEVQIGTVSSGAAMNGPEDLLFNVGQTIIGLSTGGEVTMHAGVIPCLAGDGGPTFSIVWTGDGDATSWHDPANWGLNRVPGPADDVGIPDVPATTVVVYSSGETSINSLTSDEAFQLTYGTLTIDDASVIDADFTQTYGTLTGAGDLTIEGQFTWNGGTMSGAGTTTIEAGATLSMGGSTRYLERTLDNHGTADWTAGQWRFTDGTFNNLSDGTFNASANQTTSFSSGTSAFNNDGQFNHTGTGTTSFSVIFDNSGTVEVQSGVLSFSVDYTQTAGATILNGGDLVKTGTPLDIQGGWLTGEGTVTGDIENSGGQVAPGLSGAGVLSIDGNYTQTANQDASGVLAIELGGLAQGFEYDLLAVTGDAPLAGTLSLALIDGFVLQVGDRFEVLVASNCTGRFDDLQVVGFPSDLDVQLIYNPDSVIVRIVLPHSAQPAGRLNPIDAEPYP